jgi:cyclase
LLIRRNLAARPFHLLSSITPRRSGERHQDGQRGFDGAFRPMIERFLATGDPSLLWPCHMLGRHRPYYQIERLGGLDRLPATGFLVIAFPVRIDKATAAWTRAVALVPRS